MKEKELYMTTKIEAKDLMKYLIILLVIAIFSIIFSLLNIHNTKIHKNIKVQGISIEGKTKEEAIEELNQKIRNKEMKGLKLKQGEYETNISFDQLGIRFNINEAVDEAYLIGRKGNIITNNYAILMRFFLAENIPIGLKKEEVVIDRVIEDIEKKLPDKVVDYQFYIENDQLLITPGKNGVKIDIEEFRKEIYEKIENLEDTDELIEIPVNKVEAKRINIEEIEKQIVKEAKDAYIVQNPFEVHPEEDGIEFAMGKQEIQNLLSEEKEEYSIPIKITKANITVNDLGEDAFTNLLASYKTTYDASNKNRSNNLELASDKINGTIVKQGETFSYNKTVGQRTIGTGFKEAKAYAGGKVVLDVGGGICQLSSTIYNAALLSNLEIKERSSHYFSTSYVPEGRDATVSWGAIDFKFQNNRKYPIKIESKVSDGVVTVNIYGMKQEEDYDVIIESKITGVVPSETVYKKDTTLESGAEVREQKGQDGANSETYKVLVKNGVIISKTLISKDSYNALNTIIRQGQ